MILRKIKNKLLLPIFLTLLPLHTQTTLTTLANNNQHTIHKPFINFKQQLPLLNKKTSLLPPNQLPILANHNALYTTIALGYLLLQLNSTTTLNNALYKLTNQKKPLITKQQLTSNYHNITYLNTNPPFQQIITHFLKKTNIKPGTWAGPKQIKQIAETLNINIQEYTPDPEAPNQLTKSHLTQPQNWLNPTNTTIHIVRDKPRQIETPTPNHTPSTPSKKRMNPYKPSKNHNTTDFTTQETYPTSTQTKTKATEPKRNQKNYNTHNKTAP